MDFIGQVASLDGYGAADNAAVFASNSRIPVHGFCGTFRECDLTLSVSLLTHHSGQLTLLIQKRVYDVRAIAVAVIDVFAKQGVVLHKVANSELTH